MKNSPVRANSLYLRLKVMRVSRCRSLILSSLVGVLALTPLVPQASVLPLPEVLEDATERETAQLCYVITSSAGTQLARTAATDGDSKTRAKAGFHFALSSYWYAKSPTNSSKVNELGEWVANQPTTVTNRLYYYCGETGRQAYQQLPASEQRYLALNGLKEARQAIDKAKKQK